MKKNKIFSVVLAVVVVVCGVVFAGSGDDDNVERKKRSSSDSGASWSEYFENVNEMEKLSDIGIIGTLADSKTELRGNLVFTRNIVEVVSVHSGDIQVGEFVEVLQTGGKYGDVSTSAFSEVPLMEKNKEYALFLNETEPHEVYGQYFLIAGGYQGIAEIPVASVARARGERVEFTDYFANNFD